MQPLSCIDHVAITVADIDRTHDFYDRLFGTRVLRDHKTDGTSYIRALVIGVGVQLSVHRAGNGVELVADRPTPGSVDICFRWASRIEDAVTLLAEHGIAIIEGPSPRLTSDGRPGRSVYFRDPDLNLIELMAAD